MLHGDPAAEAPDALDVAVADRLAMVRRPAMGTSRSTRSRTSRAREIVSSYVACIRKAQPLRASRPTTPSRSASMLAGISGRSTRKSSKSAAE
jgi:hypothetical protein